MAMRKKIIILIVLASAVVAAPYVDDRLQAVSVMLQVIDPQTHSLLARYRQEPFREESMPLADGTPARLYIPRSLRATHAMVVVHGVHRLGIDEPRLVAFARALAAQGIEVLTPQLPGIADYRVTPDSITTIGQAAQALHRRTGKPVGVFGLSFSGGLALLAAADPRFTSDFAFVVAVGAHDDMGRVARFFATNEAPRPNGSVEKLRAHEYGALVLMYSHPEDFFAVGDVASVETCLHAVLYEITCDAGTLTGTARGQMQHVFTHDTAFFRDRILASAAKHGDEYTSVSPHGHLGALRVPVLLLHGAGDDVIPAAETEWLAQEIPVQYRDTVLISPAISHVEMGAKPDLWDQYRVVDFIARMIDRAED